MNSLASHPAIERVHLLVPDVRCAGCCLSIEKALAQFPGVSELNVSFAEKRLSFIAQDLETRAGVTSKLESMGYPAVPDIGGEELELYKSERRQLLARLGVAGIGMMQVMMFAFTDYLAGPNGIDVAYERHIKLQEVWSHLDQFNQASLSGSEIVIREIDVVMPQLIF